MSRELKLIGEFLGEPITAKDVDPADNETQEEVEEKLVEDDDDEPDWAAEPEQ